MNRKPGLSTLAVLAGEERDPRTGSLNVPIYRTSGFSFESMSELRRFFSDHDGFIYSRFSNPTDRAVEQKLSALEGGEEGVLLASGMAAIAATVLSVLDGGQGLITLKESYGGTKNLERRQLRRLGLEVVDVTVEELSELERHCTPQSRLLLLESPTNPLLKVLDLSELCRRAHELGLLVAVDNTFATPVVQRPLELGADLVIHSATKYLGGHSDLIAGAVVGSAPLAGKVRILRADLGACPDPGLSYLLLRSMKTLPLRVREQCRNARVVAEFLQDHPLVEEVLYPGLPGSPYHDLASAQMEGFGAMISFRHGQGEAGAEAFADAVELPFLPSLGGVESSINIPAFTSHRLLSSGEKELMGVDGSLIRLSVGIEEVEDLVEILDRALRGEG